MKDRSKFLSSVIVSLFAGFLYYLLGQNVIENVPSSFKAMLSSDDSEQYFTSESFLLNQDIKKSPVKLNERKNLSHSKKKNIKKFLNNNATIPGEEMFSNLTNNNQAKFRRPSPDNNKDFTAELEQLIKNSNKDLDLKISKSIRKSENEKADLNSENICTEKLDKNIEAYQVKYFFRSNDGCGFEFNHVVSKNSTDKNLNNCKEYYYKLDAGYEKKIIPGKKKGNISPKVHIKINDEEINIEDCSEEKDSM